MSIIMLAGKIKTGKTTIAEQICMLRPSFKLVSFGDILKEDFANIHNLDVSVLHDVTKKEAYREDLVAHARVRRAKDRFFYARGLFSMLDSHPEGDYVIDDLRTIEELEMGVKRGATPHKVEADDVPRKFRGWIPNPTIDDDFTEQEMQLSAQTYRVFGGTVIANNSQSLDDAKNRAEALLRELERQAKAKTERALSLAL
jgi:phosphomevalonate kinase